MTPHTSEKNKLLPNTLDVSVVIPALNEGPNLYRLLPLLREALNATGATWEVLVVDGNSQDGSGDIVSRMGDGFRHIQELRRGYGVAVFRGITEAHGQFVITMDADMSHPAEFIHRLWENRHKGDIVIASRYVAGGHADQPFFRLMLSRILNGFFRNVLSIPVRDMSSGFRLYRKSLFENIQLEQTNFVILIEILIKAYGKGRIIAEVPFTYQPRQSGASHAQIIRFGREYLRLAYRMWAIRNSITFADYDWRAHDSRIWFQRYWQRSRHRIIKDFTPPFVSTCDVGCGSSRILADLPHAVGVDMRHDKLSFMRRTNKLLVMGDGTSLPFEDASFDCVVCSQVIEHIPNEDGRLIDELVRILRPGGVLVLGTPDYGSWQWSVIEWIYGKVAPGAYADEHVTHYTFDSLKKAIEQRGCTVEDHGYICRAELVFKARKHADASR